MPEFHFKRETIWKRLVLDIIRDDLYSSTDTTRFLIQGGDGGPFIGKIERIENYVSHQVHDRIRYDNKPVTVWRALPMTMPGLYDDTRSEALAELLKLPSRFDLHQAHRPQWFAGCTLHEESS